jgi:ankyrin repeat protein
MGFFLACLSGDLNKVKYYSELVDSDDRDFYGNSGLALACKKGHFRISEFLLGKGWKLDSKNHVLSK